MTAKTTYKHPDFVGDGMSYAEIAQEMGLREGQVRGIYNSAMNKLRAKRILLRLDPEDYLDDSAPKRHFSAQERHAFGQIWAQIAKKEGI